MYVSCVCGVANSYTEREVNTIYVSCVCGVYVSCVRSVGDVYTLRLDDKTMYIIMLCICVVCTYRMYVV